MLAHRKSAYKSGRKKKVVSINNPRDTVPRSKSGIPRSKGMVSILSAKDPDEEAFLSFS